MGFLDMFDNPDIMNSILGINAGGAMGAPQAGAGAPPAPPPQMSGGMMGEVLDRPPPPAPPAFAGPGGPPPGLGAPPMETNTGLFKHDQLPPGQPAGPTMAGAGFPPPPPGSAMAMPAAPGTASTAVPPSGVGYGGGPNPNFPGAPSGVGYGGGPIPTAVGPITPPGGPLDGRPAVPPPPGAYDDRPPTSTYGNLDAALGLTPRQRWGSAITAGMAGLGRGLSAVGNLHPGASGAQAFAAGAGGGLEGGVHELNQQQAQRRQAVMDNFLMSSTKFKDMLAAQHMDNESEFRKMQGEYFGARAAQARAAAAGGGSTGYQNTPFWKTMKVEDSARAFEKNEGILLQKQWHQNGADGPQMKKDLDDLKTRVEAERQRLYKINGISPDQAEQEKLRGQINPKTGKPVPFETKDFHSMEEFHATVPPGAYYLDEKGELRIKKPGPGAGTPAERSAAAAPNYDDYTAGGGMSTASDGEPA